MNINIVYSSNNEKDIILEENIKNTIGYKKYKIIRYMNYNEFSLSILYNRAISENYEKNSIFVFIHNDIIFKTKNWGIILINKFKYNNIDLIGVAGSDYIDETGKWWNNKNRRYGIVEHDDGMKKYTSYFSDKILNIQRCVIIDGLFMALKITQDDIQYKYFDENYGKFHFYDVASCVKLFMSGFNIGVITDIKILHKSIGRINNEWEDNKNKFIKNYYNYLPLDINDYD